MSELTASRLAELREMHKKATEPEHWQGIADRQRGVFEDFRLHLDGYDAELALALRNSASALFDLAQEALTARGKNSPADELLRALDTLVKRLDVIHVDPHYQSVWTLYLLHGGDYANGPKYDKELDLARAAISRYEEKR